MFKTPILDAVDTIVKELLSVKDDRAFVDEVMDDVPFALVVGDQSTGKSSVTGRLCHIPLEIDSQRCTIVPAHIACRRREKKTYSLKLESASDNEQEIVYSGDDAAGLKDALIAAKNKAKNQSQGDGIFVMNSEIRIECDGPEESNISFIDYPGFTSTSDSAKAAVETMVKRRIQSNNAIVLHVVRGDTDVGAIAGGVFMTESNSKHRILICTHCDQPKVKDYLPRILESDYVGSEVFAVIGNEDNDDKEVERLNELDLPDGIHLGLALLRTHLEKLLEEHIREQMPVLEKKMGAKRDEMKKKLAELDLGTPKDIAQATLIKAKERWEARNQITRTDRNGFTLRDEVRRANEETAHSLRQYVLYPPGPIVQDWRPVKDSDLAGMRKGDPVKHDDKDYVFVLQDGSRFILHDDEGDSCRVTTFLVQGASDETILKDVLQRCQNRGLRTLMDVDVQAILVPYAQEYARHCEPILKKHVYKIERLMKESFATTFDVTKYAPSAKKLVSHLEWLTSDAFAKRLEKVNTNVMDLVACNSEEELCFVNDEHYYNDMFQKMMSEEEVSLVTDDGAALSIVFKIRAWNKDARKYMAADVKKRTWLELGSRFAKDVETILQTRLSELEQHVSISGTHETRIKRYRAQVATLGFCIQMANSATRDAQP